MQKMRILGLAVAATMLAGSTGVMAMDDTFDPNAGPDVAPVVVTPPAPKKPSRVKVIYQSFTQSSKAKWGLGGALALGLFGFVHKTNIFHGRKLTQPVIDGLKKWGENIKKGDTGTIIGTLGLAAALGMGAYWMFGGSQTMGGSAGLKGIRGKVHTTYTELQLLQSISTRIDAVNKTVETLEAQATSAEEAKREAEASGEAADIAVALEKYAAAQKAYNDALTKESTDSRNALVAQLQAWAEEVEETISKKDGLNDILDNALDAKAVSKAAKRAAKAAAAAGGTK